MWGREEERMSEGKRSMVQLGQEVDEGPDNIVHYCITEQFCFSILREWRTKAPGMALIFCLYTLYKICIQIRRGLSHEFLKQCSLHRRIAVRPHSKTITPKATW